MHDTNWRRAFLRLQPQVSLKNLEQPSVYHIGRDELYEIDEKALAFLARCNGSVPGGILTAEAEFVEYCLGEGLLEALSQPQPIPVTCYNAPEPSLRYLELQLLHRCNLQCRHCYLGDKKQDMLLLDDALAIAHQFSSLGGLRLLISGGEPVMYPYLKDFIAETSDLKLRRVLLTNGTLITKKNISWLSVDNIQFSLDGWQQGHDVLRGPGTFERTLRGVQLARQAGIPVSLATMIHKGNLDEFKRLQDFAEEIGATAWDIDVLCMAGMLRQHQDLTVPYEAAAAYRHYSYGNSYHGSSDGFACGRHLMTVLPTGSAVKCGFYEDEPLGDARHSLSACWLKRQHIALTQLECRNCRFLDDCAGGCRFRAPYPLAPDPAMCAFYGQQPIGPDQGT